VKQAASAAASDVIAADSKENPGKSLTKAEAPATQPVEAFDIEPKQMRFIPSNHRSRGPEKMCARGHSRA
jgi:hypothetical protein